MAALQKEPEYLRAENAVLKKSDALIQQKEAAKAQARRPRPIRELRHYHALDLLLKAAGMARSTFYYYLKKLVILIKTGKQQQHDIETYQLAAGFKLPKTNHCQYSRKSGKMGLLTINLNIRTGRMNEAISSRAASNVV